MLDTFSHNCRSLNALSRLFRDTSIENAFRLRIYWTIIKKTGRRRTAVVPDVDKVGSGRGQFLQIGASGSVMCDDIGHVTNMVKQLCWSRAMHFRCDLCHFRASSRSPFGENALLLWAVESGSFRRSLLGLLRFKCVSLSKILLWIDAFFSIINLFKAYALLLKKYSWVVFWFVCQKVYSSLFRFFECSIRIYFNNIIFLL